MLAQKRARSQTRDSPPVNRVLLELSQMPTDRPASLVRATRFRSLVLSAKCVRFRMLWTSRAACVHRVRRAAGQIPVLIDVYASCVKERRFPLKGSARHAPPQTSSTATIRHVQRVVLGPLLMNRIERRAWRARATRSRSLATSVKFVSYRMWWWSQMEDYEPNALLVPQDLVQMTTVVNVPHVLAQHTLLLVSARNASIQTLSTQIIAPVADAFLGKNPLGTGQVARTVLPASTRAWVIRVQSAVCQKSSTP